MRKGGSGWPNVSFVDFRGMLFHPLCQDVNISIRFFGENWFKFPNKRFKWTYAKCYTLSERIQNITRNIPNHRPVVTARRCRGKQEQARGNAAPEKRGAGGEPSVLTAHQETLPRAAVQLALPGGLGAEHCFWAPALCQPQGRQGEASQSEWTCSICGNPRVCPGGVGEPKPRAVTNSTWWFCVFVEHPQWRRNTNITTDILVHAESSKQQVDNTIRYNPRIAYSAGLPILCCADQLVAFTRVRVSSVMPATGVPGLTVKSGPWALYIFSVSSSFPISRDAASRVHPRLLATMESDLCMLF